MKKKIRITESQLKKIIENTLLKEEGLFKIEPNLVFKIYDILKEIEGFRNEFPIKSHFFHYINDRL